MPLSLSLFNNEVRATNGDYSTQIVSLSSETEAAKDQALSSAQSYVRANFLPLSGGTISNNITFLGAVSGVGQNTVCFSDGLSLGFRSFAVGGASMTGTDSAGFGSGNWGGGECFVTGFSNIAGGYVTGIAPGQTLNKTPQNLWTVTLPVGNNFAGASPSYVFVTGYSDGFPAPGTFVKALFSVVALDLNTRVLTLRLVKNIINDVTLWDSFNGLEIFADINTGLPGRGAVALGYSTIANGDGAFAAGFNTVARAPRAVALGSYNKSTNDQAVSFGLQNNARGLNSFVSGTYSLAQSAQSFAHGNNCISSNLNSVAFGYYSEARGEQSVAFNRGCKALGSETFSCNLSTIADGVGSFSEGEATVASGYASHAGGRRAHAVHDRSWIWKGSTVNDYLSTTRTDQFLVSAAGGAFFPGNVSIGQENNSRALTVSGNAVIDNAYVDSLSCGVIFGDTYRETSNTYITITNTGSMNIDPAWDGKVVLVNNSSNLDISLLGFQRVGFSVTFVSLTPNTVSFSAGVGTTLNSDSNKNKIAAQFCSAVVTCYTSNTYLLIGNISN